MSLQMHWYLENRVILVRWPEIVTPEIVIEFVNRSVEFWESSSEPVVHTILDTNAIQRIPNLAAMRKAVVRMNHPRAGWGIGYGISNSLVKMIIQVTTSVTGLPFRYADTLDEALAFLNHMDATLPDLMLYKNNLPGYRAEIDSSLK
jgi:hypothetical protein